MKKTSLLYKILLFLIYILILWIPVLLCEETFIFDYVNVVGTFICSLLMSVVCFIIYIKNYKKLKNDLKNCYIYNVCNAIFIAIISIVLGYLSLELIDLNIFHQCLGTGWDCFLFGIEYLFVGFGYAILSVAVLAIWLIIRLIKYLIAKQKKLNN